MQEECSCPTVAEHWCASTGHGQTVQDLVIQGLCAWIESCLPRFNDTALCVYSDMRHMKHTLCNTYHGRYFGS